MCSFLPLTARDSCSVSSRNTSDPVAALPGEPEEGYWRPRPGEDHQVEHPSPAHRLSFLQLSRRPGRQEAARAPGVGVPWLPALPSLAAGPQGLALSAAARLLEPEHAPCVPAACPALSPLQTRGGYFQGPGKARPQLLQGAWPRAASPGILLSPRAQPSGVRSLTFLRGTLREDSSGSTGEGHAGLRV